MLGSDRRGQEQAEGLESLVARAVVSQSVAPAGFGGWVLTVFLGRFLHLACCAQASLSLFLFLGGSEGLFWTLFKISSGFKAPAPCLVHIPGSSHISLL